MMILLVGFLLRALPLQQNRALEDEALYGYWGLQIASGSDPMLDREPVDKPPFFPYLLALTFLLYGPAHPQGTHTELAAEGMTMVGAPLACATKDCRAEVRQLELESRLPSLFAGTIAIALLYSLGKRLFRSSRTGLLAALLLALSPFAVLFSSTAFVDPVLTAWVVAGLLAASTGRLGLAGALAGLSVATKQQGLLFVPLIAVTGLLGRDRTMSVHDNAPTHSIARLRLCRSKGMGLLLFCISFTAVVCAVLAWDQARDQRPGFLEQSMISYGGLRIAALSDLGERATAWTRLMASFWASPPLNVLFLIALLTAPAAAYLAARRRGRPVRSPDTCLRRAVSGESGLVWFAVALFVLLFLLAHWLAEVQLWDRYLLAIVPLAALLLARAFDLAGHLLLVAHLQAAYLPSLVALVTACLLPTLVSAEQGHLAIGGDHGAYDGIDDLAAYSRQQMPPGAVLYDHWLGHHFRFYLYGAPFHIHWYPDLVDLAQDADAYQREPRYIAFPSWREELPAADALAGAGIDLVRPFKAHRRDGTVSFHLYHLVGP